MAGDKLKPESGSPASLQAGRAYTWEELGVVFDFPADYLGIAGGMVSRPKLDSLLLITHVQEGEAVQLRR